jgi:hypothetical protein
MKTLPRYIPQGYTPIDCSDVDVAVYVHDVQQNDKTAYYAIGFAGKAGKPTFNYRFSKPENRELHIANFITCQRARAESKAKLRAERSKPHSLKVGDILDCSWGWEQTNVDFYQVTRVIGPHSVEIRQISSTSEPNSTYSHGMADRCNPVPNAFTGEPMVKRSNSTNSVCISSYSSASLWDGKPNYRSWYA